MREGLLALWPPHRARESSRHHRLLRLCCPLLWSLSRAAQPAHSRQLLPPAQPRLQRRLCGTVQTAQQAAAAAAAALLGWGWWLEQSLT